MGRQIIQQPDGRYAIWSTIVDSFIDIDCTPEDIIADWTAEEEQRIRKRVMQIIATLEAGGKPYFQLTKNWQQALATHKRVHGEAFDLDVARRQGEE